MYLDRCILQDFQEAPDPKLPPKGNRRVGTAAVEFALVAPIMFLFFLGIFELGRTFMVMELMTEAARVGCRKGIIEGTSSQQIQDAVTTFLNNSGINSQQVSISINDSSANTIEAKDTPAYTEITVVVSVPVSKISWVPNPFFTSGILSGQFTMRRE
jgi:Flp pilus assembly protein TadG